MMQFSQELLDRTIEHFETKNSVTYSYEDASQALSSLCGIFSLVFEWHHTEKKRQGRLQKEKLKAAETTPEPAQEQKHQLLTDKEAAQYICMSTAWLRQSRMHGRKDAPPFVKMGKAVRYRLKDLDAWIEERIRTNTLHF